MYRPKCPPVLHCLDTYNMFTLCTSWSITQVMLSCSYPSDPTVNKQAWVETDLDKDKNCSMTLAVTWLLFSPPCSESPHTVLHRVCPWGSYFHGNSTCLQRREGPLQLLPHAAKHHVAFFYDRNKASFLFLTDQTRSCGRWHQQEMK